MQWIDIGANLTHDSFDRDREAVIERARAHGVLQMIVTGASVASSRAAIELARVHAGTLFATAGVHPHHAAQLTAARSAGTARAAGAAAGRGCRRVWTGLLPRSVAARRAAASPSSGSCSLRPRAASPCSCISGMRTRTSLPCCASTVAACRRCSALLHRRSERELEDYLALGLSIGITGWLCDERRGAHLAALLPRIPADRLMLETDAPYLLPRDLACKPKSRRNEPMYLPHVGAAVAAARGESLEQCAAYTSANASALFALPSAPLG